MNRKRGIGSASTHAAPCKVSLRELTVPGAVLLLGLLSVQATPCADPDQPLTIQQAAEQALSFYPSVAVARARNQAARENLGEARAAWLPSLRLTASATRYEEPMVVSPIHELEIGSFPAFDNTLLQAGLALDFTLFDGGGRSAVIQERRGRLEGTEAGVTAEEQALLRSVLFAYVRVIGHKRTLLANDRRLEALALERDRVSQLLEVGRAPEIELRRIDATLASAEADRVRLVWVLDSAERELARLIGDESEFVSADRLVPVALSNIVPAPGADFESRALGSSPLIHEAETIVRSTDAAVSARKAARWPTVRAAGNYLTFGDSEAAFETEWNAGLRFDFPIFTGGALSRAIGRAEAEQVAAEGTLLLARLNVTRDLDRALAAAEEAGAQVVSLERAVEQFAEVARIEKLLLETEAGTQVDYLSAEAGLLAAEAKLVEAEHREIESRVEIARITGKLDLDWIDRNLEVRP